MPDPRGYVRTAHPDPQSWRGLRPLCDFVDRNSWIRVSCAGPPNTELSADVGMPESRKGTPCF